VQRRSTERAVAEETGGGSEDNCRDTPPADPFDPPHAVLKTMVFVELDSW
jgi:hypothetical protein